MRFLRVSGLLREFKKQLATVALCLITVLSIAEADSTYRIGIILAFQTASTAEKIDAFNSAHDLHTARKIRLNDDAVNSLDFYLGALTALERSKESVEVFVYDNWNSDSVTTEILKHQELKTCDAIIGSVSSSSAKLVAEFCKQNKILNFQPFSPSKNLTANNPYHVKLAPTIDAHAEAMFLSVCDSFSGANVIIYTPNIDVSTSVAAHLDSLFKAYNTTAEIKFTVTLLNSKDMLVNEKKTTVREQLKSFKDNILFITAFEESFVNGNLRVLYPELKTDSIIVYGMPNWLNGDVLRLDYLNDFHTHITDAFNPDSPHAETFLFNHYYPETAGEDPTRFSYLGYDVTKFVLENFKQFGKNVHENLNGQHFTGAVYQFNIAPSLKGETLNYYENIKINVFSISDYQLRRVW